MKAILLYLCFTVFSCVLYSQSTLIEGQSVIGEGLWSQNDWGYLMLYDIKYKPLESNWSYSLRYLLFDTPNYSTRIYVYEPDVLYSFSVPAFYGEGQRIVGVLKCKINRQLSLNFKIAQTQYYDNTPIRSGSIKGDKLTDFKILVKYVL
jgi:hypothetical protein